MSISRRSITAMALASALTPLALSPARAADRRTLTEDSQAALNDLLALDGRARRLAKRARAILVFPEILKAGFVFGGETGDGVLFEKGAPVDYYNISGGSWGLQIGGQSFAYALFFMTRSSLSYLEKSGGFSAGTGPSIVVINQGAGAEANTTTLTQDVYAFPFGHKGLMADLTLQGAKITRIHPD